LTFSILDITLVCCPCVACRINDGWKPRDRTTTEHSKQRQIK